MKSLFLSLFLSLLGIVLFATPLSGTVLEYDSGAKSKTKPLPFASVYWLKTQKGTTTDDFGRFQLDRTDDDGAQLVVSFVGYSNDTIDVKPNDNDIKIILAQNITLAEVQIVQRQQGAYVSRLNSVKTEVITSVGLCQLACCNLAESFENSATVDVGYADAVSGAKQIQMLGLTGLYSQLMYENMPFLRGLSAPYGLSYVPGSFMESIQISKGTASVINGFEALAGQINIEYRKPQITDPLFVNLYLNNELKSEMNVVAKIPLTERWSSALFANGAIFNQELDHVGHDGFMDMPKSKQANFTYRASYDAERYRNITTLMFLMDDKIGGQKGFDPNVNGTAQGVWGFTNRVNRVQAFTKNGFLISEKANIGTQVSATYMDMKAAYGEKTYNATEKNFYANIIYENTLSERHKLNAGASLQYNDIEEKYRPRLIFPEPDPRYPDGYITFVYPKSEVVPGVFAQYTFTNGEKTSIVAGLRYDYNTLYKQSLITPRLHIKHNLFEHGTLRASVGKAYRSAIPLAENIGLMASSRFLALPNSNELGMDDAWNYGINYIHNVPIGEERVLTLSFDAYRTDFKKQLVVDLDLSANVASFYMSDKKSYANSLQLEAKTDVVPEHWTLTLAGRYNDSKQTTRYVQGFGGWRDKLQDKIYVSKWKFLMVNNFSTNMNKWMLDITAQYNGKARLPNTNGARPDYSEPYPMLHAQLTKRFRYFDVYAGCENILNTVQKDPIISPNDPFGADFDATVIYGSLMSRTFYVGLRLTI